MRQEVLRMEHVTYTEQDITMLQDWNINIFEGEIMGLLPIDALGLFTLLDVLQYNLPLYDGYVYYRGVPVNSWKGGKRSNNRISIIGNKSTLVEGQSVACNIFVLRPGFKQELLHFRTFKRQLRPFMEEMGISIPAETVVEKLSQFERVIVELLRAIVANHKLIIFHEIGTLLTDSEISQLHKIMHYYAKKGFAFLYISPHFEEIAQICNRTAIMKNGRVLKVLHDEEMVVQSLLGCSEEYDRKVRKRLKKFDEKNSREVVLEAGNIAGKYNKNFGFQVHKGECLVIQNLDDNIFQEILQIICDRQTHPSEQFRMQGERVDFGKDRRIAVINERPTGTMLFPGMSYFDNLCFNMDHRIGVWNNRKIKRSIRQEYGRILGEEVFGKDISELSEMEKYELVYTRILLQKPEVVFCVQPFKGADLAHRIRIWELNERLLENGIAVVILAVNMSDALSLADRVIRVEKKGKVSEYFRKDFATLPLNVPWHYLYE